MQYVDAEKRKEKRINRKLRKLIRHMGLIGKVRVYGY